MLVQLVFSTKNREPFIAAEQRSRSFVFLGGRRNGIGRPAIIVGGVADHGHSLRIKKSNIGK
jgi:hypothetical protein